MGEMKGQIHTISPAYMRCISFLFHVKWPNHFYDMTNALPQKIFVQKSLEQNSSKITTGGEASLGRYGKQVL